MILLKGFKNPLPDRGDRIKIEDIAPTYRTTHKGDILTVVGVHQEGDVISVRARERGGSVFKSTRVKWRILGKGENSLSAVENMLIQLTDQISSIEEKVETIFKFIEKIRS